VAEAIELLEKGVIYEHVAKVYGINVSTLRKYVRGAELYGYSYWSRNPSLN
jgi:predicted transcriptional regulator